MFLTSLALLIYASASALAQQIVYDVAHNTTPITGTWSSGSGNVTTGPVRMFVRLLWRLFTRGSVDIRGCCQPNVQIPRKYRYLLFIVRPFLEFFSLRAEDIECCFTFKAMNPQCGSKFYDTGWSAMVRCHGLPRPCFPSKTETCPLSSSGSDPQCPTTVLNWNHGPFALQPNGSITLFTVGDGFQRIEDPCAARSDFTETYNTTELLVQWQIFTDPIEGPKLHLFAFDGSPLPPMHLLSTTPTMLPTQKLRTAAQPSTTILKRSSNVAPPIHWWNVAATTSIGAMLCSVFLV
jgi:hypothetical protein